MRKLLVLLVLISAPSFAARLVSRAADDSDDRPSSLEGLYAGVGGAGGLLIYGGNAYGGAGGEARLGYSFGPAMQIYLSGAFDDGVSGDGPQFSATQVAVYIQYHLLVRDAVMIFARGGIGVGLSTHLAGAEGSTAAGLAEGGGLGVEIRLSPGLYLTPELFYRGSNLSAQGFSDSYQALGLQLSLIYY